MKLQIPQIPFKGEYFLFLLPLFFVFHGYVENHRLIQAQDAVTLFFFYCTVSIVLTSCLFFLFRSWRKASLFTFCLLLVHFFFGSFHDALKELLKDSLLTKYSVLLICIAIIVGSAFVYFRRTGRKFNKGVRYLNTLFVILILLDVVILLTAVSKEENDDGLPLQLSPCTTCATPDIYWIVADEYAGRQQLAEAFKFDNALFENNLRSRGFHLVNNSRSNYNFTPFSIASTLNFSYLPLKDTSSTVGDVPMVMEMVAKNVLTQFLGRQGYRVFNHSIFDLPGEPRQVSSSFLPNKTKYITAQTLISRLERDLFYHLITSLKINWIVRKGVYNNLENNHALYQNTLNTSALKTAPKFTYTHLSMPHPPYYYNEFGQPNSYDRLIEENAEKDYVSYLKYSNKKLLLLVDHILKNSTQPPIIILTSDHGLRSGAPEYHFMNLCAVYTPGKNYLPYYDGLSAVNLFRVLLREQFKQQLPLLEDRTYFLKD